MTGSTPLGLWSSLGNSDFYFSILSISKFDDLMCNELCIVELLHHYFMKGAAEILVQIMPYKTQLQLNIITKFMKL